MAGAGVGCISSYVPAAALPAAPMNEPSVRNWSSHFRGGFFSIKSQSFMFHRFLIQVMSDDTCMFQLFSLSTPDVVQNDRHVKHRQKTL